MCTKKIQPLPKVQLKLIYIFPNIAAIKEKYFTLELTTLYKSRHMSKGQSTESCWQLSSLWIKLNL